VEKVVCINSVHLSGLSHHRNSKGTNAGQNYQKGTGSESKWVEGGMGKGVRV
jgi:hypothetical protein